MKISRGNLIFPFILFVISLVFSVMALFYHGRAKVFPLLLGAIPLLIFSLFQIGIELKREKKREMAKAEDKGKSIALNKLAIVLLWLVVFLVLVIFFGFMIAIPVFCLLFMKIYWKERWPAVFLTTLVIMTVVYGLFKMAFNMPMYPGIFFS